MPKLTLLLGRKTMQAYDFKQESIVIGRDSMADVYIDNPSVSRRHAEILLGDDGWLVRDLGSSSGTSLNGVRLEGTSPVGLGDEVGLGKFSIVFGKALGEGEVPPPRPAEGAAPAPAGAAGGAAAEGTPHMEPHDVGEPHEEADHGGGAQFVWESGGRQGTHYFSDSPAVLIGTDELCDLRVPRGPKHHLLVVHTDEGCDVRYLAMFGTMSVRGRTTKRAHLRNGGVVEVGGLKLTFVDQVG